MGPAGVKLVDDPAQIDWEGLADGPWAAAYLIPLLRDGVSAHLGNVHTTLRVLPVGDRVLPVTINDGGAANSWVVSPRNAYVDYASEELREVDGTLLRASLKGALATLGAVLDAGHIDRLVCVDNWCVSTNLHPPFADADLAAITDGLAATYPQHAIAWRSVHRWGDHPLADQLKALGYLAVPARSCWVWDPNNAHHRRSRDLKHDAKLLRTSGYEVVGPDQLTAADAPRLRELYNALYLDKYSKHNPWMTDRYLAAAIAGGLNVRALRKDGRLDGVLGYIRRAGFMTSPLFGYDTSLPIEVGLYRMISRVLVDEALEHGLVLHQSAGAASFKRNRRADSVMEHTWVYTRHLGRGHRLAWTTLAQAMERIAVPLVANRGL